MSSRTVTGELDGQQVSGQSPSGRARRRSTERRRNLSIRETRGIRLCENNPKFWVFGFGTAKRGSDRPSSTPQNRSRWNRRLLWVGYFLLDLRQKLQCLNEQGTCLGPLRVLEKTICWWWWWRWCRQDLQERVDRRWEKDATRSKGKRRLRLKSWWGLVAP